jgi:GntR family transcriptional regulator, transcriptional repressor for pyruvate dehydrogenase complex
MAGSSTRRSFRLADSQFHSLVAAAARSSRLADAIAQARGEFFVPADTLVFEEQIDASVTGHAAVLKAIAKQQAEAARATMMEHIEQTRAHVHSVLRGDPLGRQPKQQRQRQQPRRTWLPGPVDKPTRAS